MHLDQIPFDEFQSKKFCNAWVAAAIVGGAALTAGAGIFSANKAASTQKAAAAQAAKINQSAIDKSTGVQEEQLGLTRDINTQNQANLAPYRQIGLDANTELQSRLPFLTSPIVMDQAALENTLGYQFTRTQGLKAVQNSAAARGLGSSGAALKGAAAYATGLADQTYQTQFNLENTNRTNAFNRLKSLIDTGANATAGAVTAGNTSASIGTAGTNAIGSNIITGSSNVAGNVIGGANASAAGINATGTAVGGFGNTLAGYGAYKGLYGNSNSGGQYSESLPNPNGGGNAVGYT